MPNIGPSTARIRVSCATNVFFDISDVNFTIAPATCFWADVDCSCGVSSTTIDVDDLIAVADAWNLYQSGGGLTLAADVECRASGGCDNVNDILDVAAVSSVWGMACP